MKQRRFLAFAVVLGLLGVLAAGCVGQVGTRGWAGAVRDDDVIIVSTGGGRLDGIGADGRQIWRFPELWNIPDDKADDLNGIYGRPLIASYDGEDVVFVGDHNGYVYAFRPGDFEPGVTVESPLAASFKLDGAVIGGLALSQADDALYVTSGERVYAIRASDLVARLDNRDASVGAIAPALETEKPGVLFAAEDEIWGTPVLDDGKLLISSLDGNLYALDALTGAEMWRFEAEQGLVSSPKVVGDLVLVSGFGSTLYAVDLATGAQRWSFKAAHWIWGDAATDGERAYVGDFDGIVHAIELSSGAEAWAIDLKQEAIRSTPVVSGDTLVISTDGGWLFGIDTATESIAWQRDVGSKLNADLTLDEDAVLLAPQGCVTPESGGEKIYYTSVNPLNGDLMFATGVC